MIHILKYKQMTIFLFKKECIKNFGINNSHKI